MHWHHIIVFVPRLTVCIWGAFGAPPVPMPLHRIIVIASRLAGCIRDAFGAPP